MQTSFKVTPAAPADVPAILGFIRELAAYEHLAHEVEATEELLHRYLFEDVKCHALIAKAEDAVVGYALYFYNFSTFLAQPGIYLEDLYVQPHFRGRGIGKALILQLAQTAREAGCGRLEWSVLKWNAPSIAFYKSLGAEALDEWDTMRVSGQALQELQELATENTENH